MVGEEQANQEKELQKSLDVIVSSVDASSQLLAAHQKHANQLKQLISEQDEGPVKAELIRVLENSEKHVEELKVHIDHGHQLVKTKETKLQDIQKKLGHT